MAETTLNDVLRQINEEYKECVETNKHKRKAKEIELNKEQLLIKSEGVKDCVEWVKEKLKEEKILLKQDTLLYQTYGFYSDCGSSYEHNLAVREARMSALVEVKVSLEKYMKKLKHMTE